LASIEAKGFSFFSQFYNSMVEKPMGGKKMKAGPLHCLFTNISESKQGAAFRK
jgi:hypothetical protein